MGDNYEYSLGLNGLGTCATQYSAEYFDAVIRRDGFKYTLHFEKGELVGKMKKEPADRKKTGSCFHWRPDLEVFSDIAIPVEYYRETLEAPGHRQRRASRSASATETGSSFETTDYLLRKRHPGLPQ